MILRRSRPNDQRLALGPALAFLLPLGATFAAFGQTAPSEISVGAPAAAQVPAPQAQPQAQPAAASPAPPAPPSSPAADADMLRQHDQELDAIRLRQRNSIESEAKLKHEIEALGEDRRELNQQLIDSAARVRGVEDKIEATQSRLTPLDRQELTSQKSLEQRRAVIVEVLAA